MARYAVIDTDKVVNVIEADPDFDLDGFTLIQTDEAGPGWRYDGEAFHAPEPPKPAVPDVITPRQARLALLAAGLLDGVNAAVGGAPKATQIAWDYATEIRRDNALIASVAKTLGMTDAQVDALFIAAAAI